MKKDDKTEIMVIAESGWEYAGKQHSCGKRFHVESEQLVNLQKYIDEQIIEVVVPTRVVDEKERTKIIADTVNLVMDKYQKTNPTIKVKDMYQEEPEYVKTAGYDYLSEFARDVYLKDTKQSHSERLKKWETSEKAATTMGEAIASDGGVLVPTLYQERLLSNSLETAIVRPRATFVPMTTNSVAIPCIDETSHASNVFGGILCYWVDEGAAPTASKPKLGRVELKLNKLIALTYATEELLEDSIISMEPILNQKFGEAISFQEDDKYINGTGAGCPQGLLNAACVVSVTKETGQAGTTIVTENIAKMFARMHSPGKQRAIWIVNDDCLPQLLTLSLAVGTGGNSVGLLREQVIQGQPVMTMLGRPVVFTEKCQTLGTVGDIIFADLSEYLIGGKSTVGASMRTSIHLKFDQDEVAFKMSLRTDGQSWWKSALTPKNGSNTRSPIITLASRA